MEMKKKENKGKERKSGFLRVHPFHLHEIMRTAWNQLISSNKRVVTKTLHFFEIGKTLAKFTIWTLKVKSYLNFRNGINFSV